MKYFILGGIIGLGFLYMDHQVDKAHAEGFRVGMNYALKTDPPSEQLEMVCAGLWVGKQNQKMWNKQNAR